MCFGSAVQAVSCSLEIQQQLAEMNRELSPEKSLQHRIGIHLSDGFNRPSSRISDCVNIAGQLQNQAHPGGICISQVVYDVVKLRLSLDATYAGPLRLRGIDDLLPAYHLRPISSGPLFFASQEVPSKPRETREPDAKVSYCYLVVSRGLMWGKAEPSFTLIHKAQFQVLPWENALSSLSRAANLEASELDSVEEPRLPAEPWPPQANLNAEFLERCRQALLEYIGPMANFVLEEALTDFPNLEPHGLIQQLAAEIPDLMEAEQFRRNCQNWLFKSHVCGRDTSPPFFSPLSRLKYLLQRINFL